MWILGLKGLIESGSLIIIDGCLMEVQLTVILL